MSLKDFLEGLHSRSCPHCEGYGWLYENPGDVLRKLRQGDGMLMKDMAKELGISPTYLHDLERNVRPWKHDMIRRYLAILGEEDNKHGI